MVEVNIIGFNACTIRECNCGWNLQVGSRSVKLLEAILKLLSKGCQINDLAGNNRMIDNIHDYINFRKEV